ncbi:MAG: carbohydrate binding domain-containing protein [Bacteroidaceae bacterium]|nr:carbohydrate binding domain-containing protein [Bacteroidaceae bacterium]
MKKTFKTFALVLLTAFAFSSCVDVPAPYNLPDKTSNTDGDGGGSSSSEGTPITCAQAVELTNALADGATSSETYTITGYITEVVGDVSRNQQTFWMADTKSGGRVFEAYWANLPEGVTAFTAGTKVKITGKLMKYVNANNGNVIAEMKNAIVTILEDDGSGSGDTPAEGTAVTCAQAAELTNALPDGGTSSETYTVTGYITEVIGNVSRNQQTFWMADTQNGGRVFEAYYANLPEGVSEFAVGTKVKITGQLMKYVNNSGQVTPEIKNPTVVILEQGGGETPPPAVDGIAVTCAEAVELTNALADGGTSADAYTVTGYITEVVGNVSRNQQTFWMADTQDGGRVFEAYYANLPAGVSAFAVGMKVKLTGQLLKYVNNTSGQVTPEIKNGDVVVLEQGGGDTPEPPTPGPGGETVSDLVNGDFESWVSDAEPTGWKSASTASNATLSKSTDARNGSFACMIAAPGSANKRLATQEITLEAGSYTFSFYARSTSASPCQTRGGYVPIKDDGTVDTYRYGDYTDINNNGWTLVSYDFTLDAPTTLCLLVMNPKNSNYSTSQDILVDDATLVKN